MWAGMSQRFLDSTQNQMSLAMLLHVCRRVPAILPCSFRSASLKQSPQYRTDIWRNATIQCCLVYTFRPRNSASPSNQITTSKIAKLAGEKYRRPKVVPFSAALAADIAAIGFGEAKNPELAARGPPGSHFTQISHSSGVINYDFQSGV